MVRLITLDEVRAHSRVTHSIEDASLVGMIEAASEWVLGHVDPIDVLDSNGEVDRDAVPARMRLATLMLVEDFYSQRGGSGESWTNDNYMPPAVAALLYPLRTPTAC